MTLIVPGVGCPPVDVNLPVHMKNTNSTRYRLAPYSKLSQKNMHFSHIYETAVYYAKHHSLVAQSALDHVLRVRTEQPYY